MKSHSHQYREQGVPSYGSKNTAVYADPSSIHSHPSFTVSHVHSEGFVSQPPGYSSKASSHSQSLAPSNAQWRLPETADRWLVDSPKESGYYSEESSVGHSAESGISTHQRLLGSELCR